MSALASKNSADIADGALNQENRDHNFCGNPQIVFIRQVDCYHREAERSECYNHQQQLEDRKRYTSICFLNRLSGLTHHLPPTKTADKAAPIATTMKAPTTPLRRRVGLLIGLPGSTLQAHFEAEA